MNSTVVREKAAALFNEASFLSQINTNDEYLAALAFMDELIEDYEENRSLIILLSNSIADWEDKADEFKDFNASINKGDHGSAVLKTLMDQHGLKAADMKEELGSKSLVSMLLNQQRRLTREHIEALAKRFKVSPAIFFSQ